ncbi:MAG: 5-formyltetrahydrofolate cyclo-ligase [Bacillota bacterium]|nr:5-formyltetrahydrofolate cyclo-ligase [Bacillota bacterium]
MDSGINDVKRQLRADMRRLLACVEPAELERQSRALCLELGRWLENAVSRPTVGVTKPVMHLAAYWALPGEAKLAYLLEEIRGWTWLQVWLPRVMNPGEALAWAPLTDADGVSVGVPPEDWERSHYGIPEAPPALCRPFVPFDFMILPCLAVARTGMRLGRGAGYYDRSLHFLAEREIRPCRIVAALDVQILPELPGAAHDERVDAIASATGIEWLRRE